MKRKNRTWKEPGENLKHWVALVVLSVVGLLQINSGCLAIEDQTARAGAGGRIMLNPRNELVEGDAVMYGILTIVSGFFFLLAAVVYWRHFLSH